MALVLNLAVQPAWAGDGSEGWHRPFAVLGPDQGLPNGGILSIAQDADGFIWLGSEGGLLRYEGGRCTRWSRKDGLPSDNVDRLLAIPGGGLWVSSGLGLVRHRAGRIDPVRFESLNAFPSIQALAHDAAGRLWAATGQGLFVQSEELVFRRHPQAPPGKLLTVSTGRAGAMHVGTDQGLTTFHRDGSVTSLTTAHGLPEAGAALVGEDGAGRLWVCTGRRLLVKEPGGAQFTDRSRLLKASVTPYGAFYPDYDGALWLPTTLGGLRLQGDGASLLDASAGLPMRWVRNVFRDREGGLWILGTTLARLQGGDRVWNHPVTAGPSGDIVWSMLRDPRGDLLVGTDNGVVRLGPTGVRRIAGTEGRRVKSMAFEPSGRLWMVGTTGPALWLQPGSPTAIVAPLGERGRALNTVMATPSGQIWIGHTRLGILRWDQQRRELVQEVGPGASPTGGLTAFQMREDASGRLWVASSQGLHLREPSGQWRAFNERDGLLPYGLHGLAFLPDGSAWLHSREPQGLMRIRIDGDRVSVLERRRAGQGLRSDTVYAVEVDGEGRTWATSDQGFDCLDTQTHVGRAEGMISEDCDLLALLTEPGRIWVGTSSGLVRYEVGAAEPRLSAPMPHILHVLQGEQRLEAPRGSIGPMGPRDSSLAFRVAVPRYRHDGGSSIQVRLVGLEEHWRDLDAPLARYPSLPRGSYRFETRVVDTDGTPGPVVGLSFKVLPPWWRTWWAQSLGGLAALGLLLLIIRVREARLAQSKVALEHLVMSRTEELRHRNSELTEALGRVKQLSGLLPICASCKKIRDDRGYWNQLEHYISKHSEVGFSHGICPDCVGTLFPGSRAAKGASGPGEGSGT